MRGLGISVYLNHGTKEENMKYIETASKLGYKRIFTCLISAQGKNIDEVIKNAAEVIGFANKCGMQVVADVEPAVFKRFGTSYEDLSFFKNLGLYGIRLDLGFSGIEESIMSFNKYGIKIELNMSNGTKYVDNISSFMPNMDNILGCHNFYPHLYTGLSLEHFTKCSEQFKNLGIRTAAFVSSNAASFGPWPASDGLCTLEMHRGIPIDVQAKHLFSTGLIDDVIIANAYASEDELMKVSKLNMDMLELKLKLVPGVPDIQRCIILDELHFNRGDVSEYLIRSTQSRVKYKNYDFPVFNTPDIKRGDVLIDSSLYERYAGELQIALKDMKNTGKTNVVGSISKDELFLLDYIKPWMKFKLIEE